jgi:hypothetical protein
VIPIASVVIPAHDEAAVLARGLDALFEGFASGELDVVVVCNGCHDDTAGVARRSGHGVRVLELAEASKPAALRAGDRAASSFPRIYLDADVVAPGAAVRNVIDALVEGPALAARPPIRYDTSHSSAVVARYYAARVRVPSVMSSLWGAGVYGLSEAGRARFVDFPDVVAEDLFVSEQFAASEIEIVGGPPAVVIAPRTARDLVRVLCRGARGASDARVSTHSDGSTAAATLRDLGRLARSGPAPALDVAVYGSLAVAARVQWHVRPPARWERDESSRVP